jgi:hypothetical protein
MLDSDERPSAVAATRLFHATIPQYWDRTQLAGKEVARSIGIASWVAWDIYLFYGPDAEWTEAGLPAPAAVLGQAGGVIAMQDTLPAKGDQSRLPKFLRDRAVIAGTYAELPKLLAEVTERFRTTPR